MRRLILMVIALIAGIGLSPAELRADTSSFSLSLKGFNYVAYYNGALANADSLPTLAATGANTVAITLDYGIDANNSTVYADSAYTDTLTNFGNAIAQAKSLGLSVMARPLIDFLNPSYLQNNKYAVGEFRSFYNPTNIAMFFSSYQSMIVNVAQTAQANGATILCIGAELDQLTGPAYKTYWTNIIAAIRTAGFTGKLVYAADWDDNISPWNGENGLAAGTGDITTQISFWSALDYVGLDWYAPISDAANPTLAQLIAGWTQTPTDPTSLSVTGNQSAISYVESIAARLAMPVIFTEIGYESATDAALQPAYTSTNAFDPSLQSNLYQAFFTAWQQYGNNALIGVYFWNWDPNVAEVGPNNGANFSPQELPAQQVATTNFGFDLSVAVSGGNGGVTSSPTGISCGATCSLYFATGTPVTLSAAPANGNSFVGWGGACSGTGNCSVTMTANQTVTATFAPDSYTLSTSTIGNGTVASAPAGIDCGATCSANFAAGTPVTLTATPASGWSFSGWSGACGGNGACSVTMNAAESVLATFTQNTSLSFTLAVSESGNGTVTSIPAGINCGASCAVSFAAGTQVSLAAMPASGWSFSGWSGACSGTACSVAMNAAESVAATFTPNTVPTFTLTVSESGSGTGQVTSSPSGINCGATCSASYQAGTQVALTAIATSGSTFAGWSGGGCNGVACVVTLAADTAVTAIFVQDAATNIALVAAVLPLSRSVQVGATATAFATMINAGPGDAAACSIAPATGIPASFVFQTTDPSTNGLTGTPNTPVNIAQGAAQSFVIAFTPSAAFAPTNVALAFACANANPAAMLTGIDTLSLSASTTPVPDIVALAASGDPGYVDIPGPTGTGVFAVATVNLGSGATITASANTGAVNLPVSLTVCQTDPTSGACLASPTVGVTTTIAANATPTFGIFITGNGVVADALGVDRAFVTFTDAGGVLRGETSVAVRTQ